MNFNDILEARYAQGELPWKASWCPKAHAGSVIPIYFCNKILNFKRRNFVFRGIAWIGKT
jgi:hypothetical protein